MTDSVVAQGNSTKPIRYVDLSDLTPQQKAAVVATIKNVKNAAPKVEEIQTTAVEVLQHLLASPTWTVVEAPTPEGGRPLEGWHIGAPTIIDERPKE